MANRNVVITQPSDPGGHYADFVGVWQTDETFVLDFAAITGPPDPPAEDGSQNINAQVVARVRIAPSQVFEIMKALEAQLSMWEHRTGNVPPQQGGGGTDGHAE